MYPLVGKNIYIDYEVAKFNLSFINTNILKFEGNWGDSQVTDIVEYTTVLVAKNIYMVYWYERNTQHLVTQVQNLSNLRVYTNIVSLKTAEFFHLKGKISIYQDNNVPHQVPPTTPNILNPASTAEPHGHISDTNPSGSIVLK